LLQWSGVHLDMWNIHSVFVDFIFSKKAVATELPVDLNI